MPAAGLGATSSDHLAEVAKYSLAYLPRISGVRAASMLYSVISVNKDSLSAAEQDTASSDHLAEVAKYSLAHLPTIAGVHAQSFPASMLYSAFSLNKYSMPAAELGATSSDHLEAGQDAMSAAHLAEVAKYSLAHLPIMSSIITVNKDSMFAAGYKAMSAAHLAEVAKYSMAHASMLYSVISVNKDSMSAAGHKAMSAAHLAQVATYFEADMDQTNVFALLGFLGAAARLLQPGQRVAWANTHAKLLIHSVVSTAYANMGKSSFFPPHKLPELAYVLGGLGFKADRAFSKELDVLGGLGFKADRAFSKCPKLGNIRFVPTTKGSQAHIVAAAAALPQLPKKLRQTLAKG
eukprot:gene24406-10012_t